MKGQEYENPRPILPSVWPWWRDSNYHPVVGLLVRMPVGRLGLGRLPSRRARGKIRLADGLPQALNLLYQLVPFGQPMLFLNRAAFDFNLRRSSCVGSSTGRGTKMLISSHGDNLLAPKARTFCPFRAKLGAGSFDFGGSVVV